MPNEPPPLSRFLVRQGAKGWMVYDRQRKAPAIVGTRPMVNLTKEQADNIVRRLTAEPEGKHST
jgi:hypothetical protein